VEELTEGGFFREFCADAVAQFGDDVFGFEGFSGDDAELGVFSVAEVDDVKKIGNEPALCIEFCRVKVGGIPGVGAGFRCDC